MKIAPLEVINKLVKERYSEAKAVFWSGSISRGQGNEASDLDLMIFYPKLENAYREAFIYEEWPIDAFINDLETFKYFLEESRSGLGISGSISMILDSVEIMEITDFSVNIKELAQSFFKLGPASWDKVRIDKERFLITDMLDDIKYPISKSEQIASAVHLYEPLAQFYFRSQNKWCASGKSIIRYLKRENEDLALEFAESFAILFQTGDTTKLEALTKKILEPSGGLLWDGFRLDAPKEYRLKIL